MHWLAGGRYTTAVQEFSDRSYETRSGISLGQIFFFFLVSFCFIGIGIFLGNKFKIFQFAQPFISPMVNREPKALPLQQYSIAQLAERNYQISPITIERLLQQDENQTVYLFSYTTMGKRMTGQLRVPNELPAQPKYIVMVRGYVPPEIYDYGVGTANAAKHFATAGYVTLAPDFFGYGESDPEFSDSWEARFAKPVQVIELIRSVEQGQLVVPDTISLEKAEADTLTQLQTVRKAQLNQDIPIGIWAHSNGGQIALSVLEVLGRPIPTTLWAPVTAPFPYSILYFGDELTDEGKEQRKWIALFEEDYDAFDFSITQHVDRLRGPLQIHHGSADDSALQSWSTEFVNKLAAENKRREDAVASQSAEVTAAATPETSPQFLEPISFEYFKYPGADHNLQPGENWAQAVERDLAFFEKEL